MHIYTKIIGKVDDKSSIHDSSSVSTETQDRYRGYSSSSLRGSVSEIIYTDDTHDDEDSSSEYDVHSIRSLNSRDNESFYTAAGSEDGYRNYPSPISFFQANYESDTGSEGKSVFFVFFFFFFFYLLKLQPILAFIHF
jgi:hypothetical protein